MRSKGSIAHKYTAEQIEYLREHLGKPDAQLEDVTEAFNKKFGVNISLEAMRGTCKRHKIKRGDYRPKNCLLTFEQDAWLRENAKGRSLHELVEMLKEEFGIVFSYEQMQNYTKNHKIRTGFDAQFKKGHTPPNKGKKISPEHYAKSAPTMFKKGHINHNRMPVGAERVVTFKKLSYIWVKVAEPNKWRPKHILIWEAAHGPVPKGHKVIFADQNRRNFDLDNLLLVTDADVIRMMTNKLFYENTEATKAGVAVAKLLDKVSKLKKQKKK